MRYSTTRAEAGAALAGRKGRAPFTVLSDGLPEREAIAPDDTPENLRRDRRTELMVVGE